MINLPLVNVFETPYKLWETRRQTLEEMKLSNTPNAIVKLKLEAKVENHFDAAKHMLVKEVDSKLESLLKTT